MPDWYSGPGRFATSRLTISDIAVERIREFLASPERSAPTHNINKYWLMRRMNLAFWLESDVITISKDSNLSSRITEYDRQRIRRLPALPEPVVELLSRVLEWVDRLTNRAERFLELQRVQRQMQLVEGLSQGTVKAAFPFGSWTETRIRSNPLRLILDGWPERTLLMLHAADVIQHFAPPADPVWRVLEIGSGPAILAGLMMDAYGSRHVLVDLPEEIVVGFSFLSEFWQHKRILLPHEATSLGREDEKYDAVFLTPEQLPLLSDRRFDVAVNMFSFQEMSYETIGQYFSLIRERLAPGGIFYCANRMKKPNPHDGTVIEFARYPWRSEDEFLFDQDMGSVPGAASIHRECLVRLHCFGENQKAG